MPLPSIVLGGAVLQLIVDFMLSFYPPFQPLAADAFCTDCYFFAAGKLLLFVAN